MIRQLTAVQWQTAEKRIDALFEGSVFEKLGFDKEQCPSCNAHLKGDICLNGCHLGYEAKQRMQKFFMSMEGL